MTASSRLPEADASLFGPAERRRHRDEGCRAASHRRAEQAWNMEQRQQLPLRRAKAKEHGQGRKEMEHRITSICAMRSVNSLTSCLVYCFTKQQHTH